MSQLWNVGGTMWGAWQIWAESLKAAGPELENFADTLGKWGKWAGWIGFGFSSFTFWGKVFDKSSPPPTVGETMNYLDGIAILAAALIVGSGCTLAPIVGGIALIYGVFQIFSSIFTGKSLEENIFD